MLTYAPTVYMAGFGQTNLTPAQLESVRSSFIDAAYRLQEQEAYLRRAARDLALLVAAQEAAGADLPSGYVAQLRLHNQVVDAQMAAVQYLLVMRANTPPDQLPDPDAKPVAIPTFVIPAAGLAGSVDPRTIQLRVGELGNEIELPMSQVAELYKTGQLDAPQNGLGALAAIQWGLAIFLAILGVGVLFGGGFFMYAWNSDTSAKQETLQRQSADGVALARITMDFATQQLNACLGPNPTPAQRVACVQQVSVDLDKFKRNLPMGHSPDSGMSPFTWGVIGLAAVVGAGFVYKYLSDRKRRPQGRMAPPMAAPRRNVLSPAVARRPAKQDTFVDDDMVE